VTTLLVLVAVSLIGPLLAARLRLPAAAVLIVLGVVIGPMLLKWVGDTRTVAFTAELGFLILMFIAGMEIDFNELRRAGTRSLIPPVRTAVASLALAFGAGFALGLGVAEIMVISATSIGMPLAVLTETGTLRTPLGRQVLLTGSIGEFLSILVITVWQVSIRVGPGLGLVREIAVLALVIVASAYAMRFARALAWWFPRTLERTAADHEAAEIGVRTGLFVMLAFVVFVHTFEIEAILGAFIAGTLVSFVLREKRALEAKVSALGHGLFIPVFFIVVGVRFEPRALDAPSLRSAFLLVALAAALKVVPMLFLGSRELDRRERLAAGALLSAPLTLVVAIGVIGQQLGVVSPAVAASFVVVALVLSVVFPALFRFLITKRASA
jgi:Kef-type K+ transport system membrane component KefB